MFIIKEESELESLFVLFRYKIINILKGIFFKIYDFFIEKLLVVK